LLRLKGLRHEDFAILGEFCAKIITILVPLLNSYTKCSCKIIRKISNEFYQGELTNIVFFLVISEDTASEFQFISILAIGSDRRQEAVSVPKDRIK